MVTQIIGLLYHKDPIRHPSIRKPPFQGSALTVLQETHGDVLEDPLLDVFQAVVVLTNIHS